MKLEYIGYGSPKFEGDEEFFQEIFNHINEKNHININQKPLIEDGPYSLKFELIYKDKTHTFCIGSGGEEEKKDQEKKDEEQKEGENKEEEKKEGENNEEEKKEGENINEEKNKEENIEKKDEKQEEGTEDKTKGDNKKEE